MTLRRRLIMYNCYLSWLYGPMDNFSLDKYPQMLQEKYSLNFLSIYLPINFYSFLCNLSPTWTCEAHWSLNFVGILTSACWSHGWLIPKSLFFTCMYIYIYIQNFNSHIYVRMSLSIYKNIYALSFMCIYHLIKTFV